MTKEEEPQGSRMKGKNVFSLHNLKAEREGSWGKLNKINRHHKRYSKKRVERR